MQTSSVLYAGEMVRKMDAEIEAGLVAVTLTVRSVEEELEERRLYRDAVIWRAYQEGYSLGEIAEVTGLAKSTVALVVKMETLRRTPATG